MLAETPGDPELRYMLAMEYVSAGDDAAAAGCFEELLRQYPNGNAVDNAYSWLAISEGCAGNEQKAKELNREIVRRFPFTRHATYARNRLANRSSGMGCYAGQFYYSY